MAQAGCNRRHGRPALGARPRAASRPRAWPALPIIVLAVAELPLRELAPLLRFDAQRGHRPRLEAPQADLVAGFLAVAIRAVFDALQSRVDLLQQLALAVAGAKLETE